MTALRRVAIVVIAVAGVLTALIGVAFVVAVLNYDQDWLWRLIAGVCGVAAATLGSVCAWFAVADLRRGALSPRSTRWTWAATSAFAALSFLTFWWAVLGVVGPLVTFVFVRLARARVAIN